MRVILIAGLLALSGCTTTAATVDTALDTAGSTIDSARGVAEDVIDRVYKREVALICRKSIRAHAQAISDGVMSAKALPLLCPDVDAFVSTIKGAKE